jgi:hypothetical protein
MNQESRSKNPGASGRHTVDDIRAPLFAVYGLPYTAFLILVPCFLLLASSSLVEKRL